MRRVEKEGLVRLAFMYLYCELYVVTGRKIYHIPFAYTFASFDHKTSPEALLTVDALRQRMKAMADTLLSSISEDTLAVLRELGETVSMPDMVNQMLSRLPAEDVRFLGRYVAVRTRFVRRGSEKAFREIRDVSKVIWREITEMLKHISMQ
jgi:hypothetical protein